MDKDERIAYEIILKNLQQQEILIRNIITTLKLPFGDYVRIRFEELQRQNKEIQNQIKKILAE